MKYALALLAVLALSGCARFSNHSYGSWLDQVGNAANPPALVSDEQALSLTADVMRLRGEAEDLRLKLAGETDRVRRVAHLRELQAIGDRLRPIERVLRDARRPIPPSSTSAARISPSQSQRG